MSIQTTLARAEARAAEDAWRGHKFGCPTCTAQRKRRPAEMCSSGARLYRVRGETMRDLERERELDKQPITGQATNLVTMSQREVEV